MWIYEVGGDASSLAQASEDVEEQSGRKPWASEDGGDGVDKQTKIQNSS